MLTGDVNGDGFADLIKVDKCSPTGGECAFSRIRVDLGPNSPDSDSCFLNPGVGECEVEFDVAHLDTAQFGQVHRVNVDDMDLDGIGDFAFYDEIFNGRWNAVDQVIFGDFGIGGDSIFMRAILPLNSWGSSGKLRAVGDLDSDGLGEVAISYSVDSGVNMIHIFFMKIINSIRDFQHDSLGLFADKYCFSVNADSVDINRDGIGDLLIGCSDYRPMPGERQWIALFYGHLAPGQWGTRLADLYFESPEGLTPVQNRIDTGDINNDGWSDLTFMVKQIGLDQPFELWIQFGYSREGR